MKRLPFPAVDDAVNWQILAGNATIADHAQLHAATHLMMLRYQAYHQAGGDLSGMVAVGLSKALEARLASLYTRPPAALAFLDPLRRGGSPTTCPMCGSLHARTLDHMLPKTDFPEFYVYSRNLVPACLCNSLRKENFKGLAGERVLHPYYDDILQRRLVRARFLGPFPEANVSILVCVRQGPLAPAVRYHVRHTLEKMNVLEYWTELWVGLLRQPEAILRLPPGVMNESAIKLAATAMRDSADAECATPNNWRSMFYSGVISSRPALRYLAGHVNGIRDGTIDPESI